MEQNQLKISEKYIKNIKKRKTHNTSAKMEQERI